jgi:hypothetical protein
VPLWKELVVMFHGDDEFSLCVSFLKVQVWSVNKVLPSTPSAVAR